MTKKEFNALKSIIRAYMSVSGFDAALEFLRDIWEDATIPESVFVWAWDYAVLQHELRLSV